MKVEQLMTRAVKTSGPHDGLSHPARLMWEGDVGCIPVVDADNRIVGIITDRDIAMAAYTQGRPLDAILVESAMAKQVHTCSPQDPVSFAEQCMQKYQVRRLPVADSAGRLVGILSMNDIALEAAREQGSRKPQVQLDTVALTLAQVCQHRVLEALAAQ
jgi:CBS domain-containing protein